MNTALAFVTKRVIGGWLVVIPIYLAILMLLKGMARSTCLTRAADRRPLPARLAWTHSSSLSARIRPDFSAASRAAWSFAF